MDANEKSDQKMKVSVCIQFWKSDTTNKQIIRNGVSDAFYTIELQFFFLNVYTYRVWIIRYDDSICKYVYIKSALVNV